MGVAIGGYEKNDFMKLDEKAHVYTDKFGAKYESVSRVLNTLKEPFDANMISLRMAKGDKEKQKLLLKEWENKRNSSASYGTRIHNAMEDYFCLRKVNDKKIELLAKEFSVETRHYAKIFPEAILYSFDHKIAGTTDLLLQRQSRGSIYDFYDYKTNIERGIYFDSISRKNGARKHYNKFLLSPLDHLEDCNYNTYVLQLSAYAYMAELTYGIRPGKLFIVFIFPGIVKSYDYRMIPVPYMKMEVIALFNYFNKLKKL